MIFAYIDGDKRQPLCKGERTACRDCGGLLSAVMPVQNVAHWRHQRGDCDPWSEPEGAWHLGWKERFDPAFREIGLRDPATGELHRADLLCNDGTPHATVVELQHSPISEDERIARESFYRRGRRMFWLVHLHDEQSFLGTNFRFSLDFSRDLLAAADGQRFSLMRWVGRSKQFIEKWKRADAHVFFDLGGHIFQLAPRGWLLSRGRALRSGEFALSVLTRDEFIRAVHGG
jgi:hypothetical protein